MESSILRTPKPDRVKRYDVTPSSTKKKRAAGHDNQNASATPSKRSPCTPCNALRSPTHSAKQTHSDRFIPVRPESFEVARFNLLGAQNDENASNTTKSVTPLQSEYKRAMREALLDAAQPGAGAASAKASADGGGGGGANGANGGGGGRVLAFAQQANGSPRATLGAGACAFHNDLQVLGGAEQRVVSSDVAKSISRAIPTAPTRILDAPDIIDDYYLNLIAWGANNVLAVALNTAVYLWNASTNEVTELMHVEQGDCVTSVAWTSSGGQLAVGTDSTTVQLWDAAAATRVRSLGGHTARVGSLAWNPSQSNMLSSGSRDSTIVQHDARAAGGAAARVATCVGHQQEVCGLRWSTDGRTLASGGNENYLCLWDVAMSGGARGPGGGLAAGEQAPRLTLTQHNAAVKALAWCPFQRNLLASGGGTADRTIKFWNASSGAVLQSVDTGSQVCSLLWSKHQKELVSSHGFSQNQLCLWHYPTMTKLSEFTGHSSRVLHMDQSPDGSMVVSAAADETLRFWNVFGAPPRRARAAALARASLPFLPSLNARARDPPTQLEEAQRGARTRVARIVAHDGRDGRVDPVSATARSSSAVFLLVARDGAQPRGRAPTTTSPQRRYDLAAFSKTSGHAHLARSVRVFLLGRQEGIDARARAVESAFRSALTKPECERAQALPSAWPSPHTLYSSKKSASGRRRCAPHARGGYRARARAKGGPR